MSFSNLPTSPPALLRPRAAFPYLSRPTKPDASRARGRRVGDTEPEGLQRCLQLVLYCISCWRASRARASQLTHPRLTPASAASRAPAIKGSLRPDSRPPRPPPAHRPSRARSAPTHARLDRATQLTRPASLRPASSSVARRADPTAGRPACRCDPASPRSRPQRASRAAPPPPHLAEGLVRGALLLGLPLRLGELVQRLLHLPPATGGVSTLVSSRGWARNDHVAGHVMIMWLGT